MEMEPRVAQTGAPRIAEWLSESFALFQKEWQVWLGQGAIAFLLPIIPLGIGAGLLVPAVITAVMASAQSASGSPSTGTATVSAALVLLAALLFLGGMVLQVYFLAGMTQTAARQLRGEPIAVQDVLRAGGRTLPDFCGWLIIALVCGITVWALVLPALLLFTLWFFAHPLIVERRAGVFDAMAQSWRTVRPHLWSYLLWVVVVYLIYHAGSLVVIGYIVTMPVAVLMLMVSFRDAIGIPGAVPVSTGTGRTAPLP